MNYTKYLRNKKFQIILVDEKIILAMNILKDINQTKLLLGNFNRISNFLIIVILSLILMNIWLFS